MADTSQLNERQKKFCEEYIVDFNASNAAIRAGYKLSNARSTGCKLLQYSVIDAYIVQLRDKQRRERAAMVDQVMHELFVVAFSDVGGHIDLTDEQQILDLSNQMQSRAIASVHYSKSKATGNVQVHIKMHDKVGALKVLAKCLDMFAEKPRSPDDYVLRAPRREPSVNDILRYEQNAPQGLPPETEDGLPE